MRVEGFTRRPRVVLLGVFVAGELGFGRGGERERANTPSTHTWFGVLVAGKERAVREDAREGGDRGEG